MVQYPLSAEVPRKSASRLKQTSKNENCFYGIWFPREQNKANRRYGGSSVSKFSVFWVVRLCDQTNNVFWYREIYREFWYK